jgi:hypothetical protein
MPELPVFGQYGTEMKKTSGVVTSPEVLDHLHRLFDQNVAKDLGAFWFTSVHDE